MSSAKRAPSTLVADHVARMSFLQACRLLRADELKTLVITTAPRLSFQPSDLFEFNTARAGRVHLQINCFGLTGPAGALPLVYSDFIHQRRRLADSGPGDFVNLFSHRAALLLFRAWRKHQPLIAFEAARGSGQDPVTAMLVHLCGFTSSSTGLSGLNPATLAGFASLLATSRRPAAAIAQAISIFCGFDVKIETLQSRWLALPEEEQSAVGGRLGKHNQLGINCVAGKRVLDVTSAVRIVTAPLDLDRFQRLLFDPVAQNKVRSMVRALLPAWLELRFNPVLAAAQTPAARLNANAALGRSGWLAMEMRQRDADDCVILL
jgi:type VI secretion system protein ImpH